MERFYYHGLGDFYPNISLDMALQIINSGGLKSRNEARKYGDDNYSHVCVYKKNEEYDYSDIEKLVKSVRGGWIDHCVFFIISPDIEAKKVIVDDGVGFYEDGTPYTNLVDEWRTDGNVPLDKIVGIAIPFDSIKEKKERFPYEFDEEFDRKLKEILDFALKDGWMVENSDEVNLVDRLDSELNEKHLESDDKKTSIL